MSKLWNIIGDTAYMREERRLPVPDHTTEKLSCWTYADMKREFVRSMEFFAENGFSDECVSLAYICVCLKLYFTDEQISLTPTRVCLKPYSLDNKKSVEAMTENVMANTIRVIEAFKVGREQTEAPSRQEYEEQISVYRSAETHGLALSPEEQPELDRDIEKALELIKSLEYPNRDEEDDDDDGIEIPFDRHFGIHYDKVIKAPPPADSDARLRAKLSDRAYEMLTEYEREDEIVDMDFLENGFLKPNDLELTDELREFVELYAGREYVWHYPSFFMDYPLSLCSYRGYSVDLFISWSCHCRGELYIIPAMSEFIPAYTGPEVGSDGKIHFWGAGYCKNYPEFSPLSPEEFFEREARQRYRDQLVTDRRRELENKYLIPEIRTASM